ncbi:MAG: replicative DNA helicase [Propionibacteriaceae bacterium]|nr:replicative DNA helicase [Propionibacteriaceae bacterium]
MTITQELSYAPTDAPDRNPPQDIAAEQSVLGAMLMSKDAIANVMGIVKGRDFYKPAHELIFDTILSLYSQGVPADAITVAEDLNKQGAIARAGGYPYISDLYGAVSIAANGEYYAHIVREKAILRRLVNASIRIAQLGYAGQGDVDDIVDQAQQTMYEISDGVSGEDYQRVSELLQETWDEMDALAAHGGRLHGVPTGFTKLDELTNGLHPGQMIIVAARPSIGKSTVALDMARSAAVHNMMTTAVFSLEMSSQEIMMRLLSAEASVPLKNIRTGQLDDYWDNLSAVTTQISAAPLFIDDSPNLTMLEIRAKARRLKQHHDLKLIIIDYIQLMTSGRKVESRQLEVSEFSRQIKLMAKELDIPVVAISQLNRGTEARADKKPLLSDLRESGSLEQDADMVILLHRADYYNKDDHPGEADLIVAKHRNGRTETVHVIFEGQMSRFRDDPDSRFHGSGDLSPSEPL